MVNGVSHMKKILLTVVLIFIVVLISLSSRWEDAEYGIYYIDGEIPLGIKMGSDWHMRVDHKVVAAGSDDKYVVVMQQYPGTESLYFYYVEKERDNIYLDPDEITKGPFSRGTYLELKESLGLPEFEYGAKLANKALIDKT